MLPPREKRSTYHLVPSRDPVRVLLVEAEETDYAILRALLVLGNSLCGVTWVRSPGEALVALEQEAFDACLLGVSPATASWLEQLASLRAGGRGMPVVVLVPDRDGVLDARAMAAGAQDFLIKTRLDPFTLERAIRYARTHARTMATLRRSEQGFRGLIENTPDAIFVHRAGQILYVNPEAMRWLGFVDAELEGRAIAELMAGDADGAERRFRRKDGALVTAEVATIGVDWNGEAATAVVARDLTERKQMQARLLAADRMASLGTLAAGVAHEINNPLAYVIANLDILRGELSDLSQLESIERAREGADRVRRVVRDLKVFSRPDDETPRAVDVHRVLDSSIDMAQNEIRHRARLVREYGKPPLARASDARLGQVFLNVLINAAQAIQEGAADRNQIRVCTGTDAAGAVLVEIRDSGCGMPPAVRERIFDPFFTTKPVGVGTGLGLSICHGIITGLGGRIEVESESGRGTCVRIVVPGAEPATPRPLSRVPRTAPVAATCRARVLVVDDEPPIGRAISRLLSGEHDVTALTSARNALERIRGGERFDAILCDLMMPDMSGMDLHAELAQSVPDQAKRMVFMTGGAFTARSRAFIEQARRRIEKPFERGQLLEAVAAASEA